MANILKVSPFVLDTAGTTLLWPHPIKVDHFEMASYTADTDTATLTDKDGNVIWLANGQADLSNVISNCIGWVHGLKLTALTSGKVLVYFE